jgi:hypothetical protein
MTTEPNLYFQSAIAGVIAVIAAVGAIVVVAIISVILMSQRSGQDSVIGWDPISFARDPLPWIGLTLAFVAGFWWKYHRLGHH